MVHITASILLRIGHSQTKACHGGAGSAELRYWAPGQAGDRAAH
jgi:hypothetical protein